MARKYFIETFGCQMNYHDSERMAGLLEADGYELTPDPVAADLLVLNTCSVRERAVSKVYSRLGELRALTAPREHPPVVAVTGCVAQQEGARLLARDRTIDVVVGTQQLKELPALVNEAIASRQTRVSIDPHEDTTFPLGLVRHGDPVRAWVTVIEGCNEFCSFCVVPYTRGHERMRAVADILGEVREAVRTGRREVQLLGQIVNHYQAPDDGSCDFAELLARVSDVPGLARVRFSSPHPRFVTDRLIDAVRGLDRVCKHVHMPVQSGSDRILGAMRRRYTRDEYLALVARLRESIPGLALSTDVIVGFPGETDDDFACTLDLVRHIRFHAMYSFKYSARPNTLAMKRMADDVPEREKTRRIVALQALQRDVQAELYEAAVGTTETVLVDSTSRRRSWELSGRTSGNTVVNFPGEPEWLGQLVDVRITAAMPNTLRGDVVGVRARDVEEAHHAD